MLYRGLTTGVLFMPGTTAAPSWGTHIATNARAVWLYLIRRDLWVCVVCPLTAFACLHVVVLHCA